MLMSLRTATGLTGIVLACAAMLTTGGCIVESGNGACDCGTGGAAGSGGSGGAGGSTSVVKATIDVDQTLDTAPGEGIGVFIEYASGGTWHVFTSCDTAISGLTCAHNVSVTVPASASFGNIKQDGLEGADTVYEYTDGLELATDTSTDLDGVYFDTDPGAKVRFEVWLDGQAESRFVYWVGGGAVHAGAPSNPVDLIPSAP